MKTYTVISKKYILAEAVEVIEADSAEQAMEIMKSMEDKNELKFDYDYDSESEKSICVEDDNGNYREFFEDSIIQSSSVDF